MATAELQTALEEKVIDYLQDAQAMEQHVLRALDSMIATTNDPETLTQLKRHRMDTERHEMMLRDRLHALGHGPSYAADAPAIMSAWVRGLADQVRADKPCKNASDGYVTEHVEIAAYELLERLAKRAGDLETARVAHFIREDEEQMARWIASHWDRFLDLTLSEGGFERGRISPHRQHRTGRRVSQGAQALLRWLTLAGIAGGLWFAMGRRRRHSIPDQPRL